MSASGLRSFAAVLVLLAVAAARAAGVPRLDHVFVILLENTNYEEITDARAAEAPYLNGLAAVHVRHEAYYAVTHPSLGNYTALVSGRPPISLERRNCPRYSDCIRAGPTLVSQLDEKGFSWRGYFESMPAPCTFPTGWLDDYQVGYATRHNPFVYFQDVVGRPEYCRAHVVPYEKDFKSDLESAAPNFAFIVPDTCNDGHDAGCRGTKSTIEVFDAWLRDNAPPILRFVDTHPRSALFITFDEAESGDRSACCSQPPGRGGGHIDFVMIAPGFERAAGYRAKRPANHYSFLRTLEETFALPPLGEAGRVEPMTDLFAR